MQFVINRLSYQKLCVHNTVEIKCVDKHIGFMILVQYIK